MRCASCNEELREDAKFCPHCGTEVARGRAVPGAARIAAALAASVAVAAVLALAVGHMLNQATGPTDTLGAEEGADTAKAVVTLQADEPATGEAAEADEAVVWRLVSEAYCYRNGSTGTYEGGPTGSASYTYEDEYDGQGRLIAEECTRTSLFGDDQSSLVTTTTYDEHGSELSVKTVFTKDGSSTTQLETSTEYEYDSKGRVLCAEETDLSDGDRTVYEYEYDDDGNTTLEKSSQAMSDGRILTYTHIYSYVDNRPTSHSLAKAVDGEVEETSGQTYNYSADGRLVYVSYDGEGPGTGECWILDANGNTIENISVEDGRIADNWFAFLNEDGVELAAVSTWGSAYATYAYEHVKTGETISGDEYKDVLTGFSQNTVLVSPLEVYAQCVSESNNPFEGVECSMGIGSVVYDPTGSSSWSYADGSSTST